jgi:hypothetical protein
VKRAGAVGDGLHRRANRGCGSRNEPEFTCFVQFTIDEDASRVRSSVTGTRIANLQGQHEIRRKDMRVKTNLKAGTDFVN